VKKKNSKTNPASLPFSLLGTGVMAAFIFFFMLLPGGLITFHAIQDFIELSRQSAALPVLTGTAMAILLGCLLFLTGCFILWKIIKPSH
jgi:hypothetical protein